MIADIGLQTIVDGMRGNNPGRPIPSNRVLGLPSIAAANRFLLENPEKATVVVHFRQDGEAVSYSLQTNTTVSCWQLYAYHLQLISSARPSPA